MRTRQNPPANDPHPPAARAERIGHDLEMEARLAALLHDRRTRRMLRDDRGARDLMLRVARAVRREQETTRTPR